MHHHLILGVPLGLETGSRRSHSALPRAPLVAIDCTRRPRRATLRHVAAHRLHALADRIAPQPAAA